MVSRVIPVDHFDLVLFGATGDLARRKILPSLFHRFIIDQFDENSRVIGASRSAMTQAEFRELVSNALKEFAHPEDATPDNMQPLSIFWIMSPSTPKANRDGTNWPNRCAIMWCAPFTCRWLPAYLPISPDA